MKPEIIKILAVVVISFIAAALVMIIHELVKTIAYSVYIRIYNKKYNKLDLCSGIFKIHRYIDPVGMILAVTNNVIFSKQYPFVIRSRKASFLIGLIGYLTIGTMFVASVVLYRTYFGHDISVSADKIEVFYAYMAFKYFLEYVSYFTLLLFIVNLYPIATFDMALCVASISPLAYIKIRKFDLFYKLIFLVLSLLGVFSTASVFIASKAIGY